MTSSRLDSARKSSSSRSWAKRARSALSSGALEASPLGFSAYPCYPGVVHLHVIGRALTAFRPHLVQLDGGALVDRVLQAQKAHYVRADVIDKVVEVDRVAGPLGHSAAGKRDHLAKADFEPLGVHAQGGDPRREAGDLALVVGAPDVDDPVEASDEELVAVIGNVSCQIGVIAGGGQRRAAQRLVAQPGPRRPATGKRSMDRETRPRVHLNREGRVWPGVVGGQDMVATVALC